MSDTPSSRLIAWVDDVQFSVRIGLLPYYANQGALKADIRALVEQFVDITRDCEAFVNALDLHKARIRQLQAALCECSNADFLQADLHDETCPVYVVTRHVSSPASEPKEGA